MRTHYHENSKEEIHPHEPITSHRVPPRTLRITIWYEIWVGTQRQIVSVYFMEQGHVSKKCLSLFNSSKVWCCFWGHHWLIARVSHLKFFPLVKQLKAAIYPLCRQITVRGYSGPYKVSLSSHLHLGCVYIMVKEKHQGFFGFFLFCFVFLLFTALPHTTLCMDRAPEWEVWLCHWPVACLEEVLKLFQICFLVSKRGIVPW